MTVTTKLTVEANALLDGFLGFKRMKGEHIAKEAIVEQFVREGVRKHLSPDALAIVEQQVSKIKVPAQ